MQSKSMDWFLYDKDLRHERVNLDLCKQYKQEIDDDLCG